MSKTSFARKKISDYCTRQGFTLVKINEDDLIPLINDIAKDEHFVFCEPRKLSIYYHSVEDIIKSLRDSTNKLVLSHCTMLNIN
jgi:hypothetical protein